MVVAVAVIEIKRPMQPVSVPVTEDAPVLRDDPFAQQGLGLTELRPTELPPAA